MSLNLQILTLLKENRDVIVTSCYSSKEVLDSVHGEAGTIFWSNTLIRTNDEVDTGKRSIEEVLFRLSDTESRKPQLVLCEYGVDDFAKAETCEAPSEESVDYICLMDAICCLTRGSCAWIDLKGSKKPRVNLTPIESLLSEAMKRHGIEYTEQEKFGKYTADFVVRIKRKRFLVEADGRAYHSTSQDNKRDEEILERYGLKTLRFPGHMIFHDVEGCIERLKSYGNAKPSKPANHLMEDEELLDDSQREAIRHSFGSAQVVAPAGSGKTKVLINHVVELISRGINPREILCLAYNKHASEEMMVRLRDLAIACEGPSKSDWNGVTVGTLHGFGYALLQQHSGRKLQVCARREQDQAAMAVLRDVSNLQGVDIPYLRGQTPWISMLDEFSRIKNGLALPEESSFEVNLRNNEKTELPTSAYLQAFDGLNARKGTLTFDDLLYVSVSLLLKHSLLRHEQQNRFRYIVVDEYQDLNPVQVNMLKLLSATGQSVFAVGDDDQLIYSWRHVRDSNLADIQKHFGHTTQYKLNTNYRSSIAVVESSQRLIAYNNNRISKGTKPGPRNLQGLALVKTFEGITDQLDAIVTSIRKLKAGGAESSSIAILTRMNAPQVLLAHALDKAGIARSEIRNTGLYSTPVVKVLASYVSVILNPETAKAQDICNIVNKPNRYLSNEFVAHIKRQKRCWHYLKEFLKFREGKLILDPQLKVTFERGVPGVKDKWRGNALSEFIKLIEGIHGKVRKVSPNVLIEELLGEADFRVRESEESRDQSEATDDMLIDLLMREASDFDSVEAFLSDLKSKTEFEDSLESLEDPEADNRKQRVTLSTYHGAKGKEWEHVYIFDANDSTSVARGTRRIKVVSEEERRLFYVAMTRARLNLFITARKSPVSQFLEEAFVPQNFKRSSNPLKALEAHIEDLEKSISKLEREREQIKAKSIEERRKSKEQIAKLEMQRKDYNDRLNDVLRKETGGFLARLLNSSLVSVKDKKAESEQYQRHIDKLTEQIESQILKQASQIESARIRNPKIKRESDLAKLELNRLRSFHSNLKQLYDVK